MLTQDETKGFRRWLRTATDSELQGRKLKFILFRDTQVTEQEVRKDVDYLLREIDEEIVARKEAGL